MTARRHDAQPQTLVLPGLDPGIHVWPPLPPGKAWVTGMSPATNEERGSLTGGRTR